MNTLCKIQIHMYLDYFWIFTYYIRTAIIRNGRHLRAIVKYAKMFQYSDKYWVLFVIGHCGYKNAQIWFVVLRELINVLHSHPYFPVLSLFTDCLFFLFATLFVPNIEINKLFETIETARETILKCYKKFFLRMIINFLHVEL